MIPHTQSAPVTMEAEHLFSVIIPTLNEAETIGVCISNIKSAGTKAEIIVVDGGSGDATTAIAQASGATVLRTEPCRGLQCNCGAAIASGKILVFLHADTILPNGAFDKLSEIFSRREVEVGNFKITFDVEHWFLRLVAFLSRFDPGLFRFGDQGIVIRRTLFEDLGGFPDWKLFEDLALIHKARKRAKIHRFPMPVTTSARRLLRNGIIRQQLKNVYYTIEYMLGIPPWRLAEKYYGTRLSPYQTSLVIFLRLPASGKVKTRLAKTLGNEAATMFYRACAEHLFNEAEKLPPGISRHVYYTPWSSGDSVQRWAGPHFRFRPQVGGDLGKKLKTIFHDQFRTGVKKVIIVATDVPDLSAPDIEEAALALDKADLVLGPSIDGGYYLIGMNEPHPALFDGILWSTDVVYEQTMRKAGELGLKVHKLRVLDDIDTEDDFLRWQKRPEPAKHEYVTLRGQSRVISENGKN